MKKRLIIQLFGNVLLITGGATVAFDAMTGKYPLMWLAVVTTASLAGVKSFYDAGRERLRDVMTRVAETASAKNIELRVQNEVLCGEISSVKARNQKLDEIALYALGLYQSVKHGFKPDLTKLDIIFGGVKESQQQKPN